MDLDALEEALFGNELTASEVAMAVLLLVLGALGYFLTGRIMRRALRRAKAATAELTEVMTRIMQFLVMWLFVGMALNVLGADAEYLTFMVVALLAVAAFTAKPLLDGMVSSVAVATGSAVNVGQEIEIGTTRGLVEGLEKRSTVVRTVSGSRVHLSNSEMLDANVTVLNAYPLRRSIIDLHLAFAADLPAVEALITEALSSADHVSRVERVRVVSLDKGMRLAIDLWHGSTIEQERLAQDSANRAIMAAIKANDIKLVG
jgi:small-conductance mechanosensitive channel